MTSDASQKAQAPLPDRTVPRQYPIRLRGFGIEEAAQGFGNSLAHEIGEISRHIDLERLDGVTVAYDYKGALSEIDRGHPGLKPLTPSEDYGLGVAMNVSVMRSGQMKSHVVFDAHYIEAIGDCAHPEFADALYIVAHECAHAKDLKFWEMCLPGLMFKPIKGVLRGYLLQVSEGCWSEYSASRQSAIFHPKKPSLYELGLIETLAAVRRNANECIIAYRLHGDNQQVFEEVLHHYGTLLKQAAYLIGHQDGLGLEVDSGLEIKEALNQSEWFRPFLDQLATELRVLWKSYGAWKAIDEFETIGEVTRGLLSFGGVSVEAVSDEELYIDVPFTIDTVHASDRLALMSQQILQLSKLLNR